MAEVRHTEIFNCTPEQFFSILKDCEKYPEFLSEVNSCQIVADSGGKKQVKFEVSVVKTISYVNEHEENEPHELKFKFLEGDLFKSMHGHWKLSAEGDSKTKAEYFVEASFGMFVPGAMTKTVISANLPNMMKSYHKRVAQLFG